MFNNLSLSGWERKRKKVERESLLHNFMLQVIPLFLSLSFQKLVFLLNLKQHFNIPAPLSCNTISITSFPSSSHENLLPPGSFHSLSLSLLTLSQLSLSLSLNFQTYLSQSLSFQKFFQQFTPCLPSSLPEQVIFSLLRVMMILPWFGKKTTNYSHLDILFPHL